MPISKAFIRCIWDMPAILFAQAPEDAFTLQAIDHQHQALVSTFEKHWDNAYSHSTPTLSSIRDWLQFHLQNMHFAYWERMEIIEAFMMQCPDENEISPRTLRTGAIAFLMLITTTPLEDIREDILAPAEITGSLEDPSPGELGEDDAEVTSTAQKVGEEEITGRSFRM